MLLLLTMVPKIVYLLYLVQLGLLLVLAVPDQLSRRAFLLLGHWVLLGRERLSLASKDMDRIPGQAVHCTGCLATWCLSVGKVVSTSWEGTHLL